MAGKVYSEKDIMKMAVGLIDPDIEDADYDGDGKVTSSDARARDRISSGLSVAAPSAGNTGVVNAGNANKNTYAVSNAYQNQADAIYKKIQETPDFKYDFNEDAVFQALREKYMKDGRLAAENVSGQAAALSGGYGNSYGATAAGQAYMGAIDDLYDVVPELENAAYGRYQDKRNADLQNWEIMQNRADAERGYAYDERAYQDSRDAYIWELALQKAQYGDYSGLRELGVDTSGAEYDSSFSKALQLAQLGDYSGLQALGIDTSTVQKQNELDFALAAAEVGDYSFLKALGIDTSSLEAPKVTYSGGSGGYVSDDVDEGGEVIPDYDGDGKVTSADMRTALRQSQGLDASYEQDELDKTIERLQAVIDNPEEYGPSNVARAKKQLNELKEQYYG